MSDSGYTWGETCTCSDIDGAPPPKTGYLPTSLVQSSCIAQCALFPTLIAVMMSKLQIEGRALDHPWSVRGGA